MTEQDIFNLIRNDKWMMNVLRIVEKLDLPDWAIGAGFVRNKVWDYLHEHTRLGVDTPDVDLVYYDPNGNNVAEDKRLSAELNAQTGIAWEVVNQVYAHKWNRYPPYTSTENSISTWSETATCIGVKIEPGGLKLIAPHGIDNLVNLILRPNPTIPDGFERLKGRAKKKQWLEKWLGLKLLD